MKIKGLSTQTLEAIAEQQGFKIQNVREVGRFIAFVLRPGSGWTRDTRYACFGHHDRLVHAVCFHGHRAFMEQVFRSNPEATIVTTMARYPGRKAFEATWRDVAGRRGFAATTNCRC